MHFSGAEWPISFFLVRFSLAALLQDLTCLSRGGQQVITSAMAAKSDMRSSIQRCSTKKNSTELSTLSTKECAALYRTVREHAMRCSLDMSTQVLQWVTRPSICLIFTHVLWVIFIDRCIYIFLVFQCSVIATLLFN